jgi:hypothetical protein
MVNTITAMISVLIMLFVFIYPKGALTAKIYLGTVDKKKLSGYELFQCYTPFYNSVLIRRRLYDRAGLIAILNNVFIALIIISFGFHLMFRNYGTHSPLILVALLLAILVLLSMLSMYFVSIYINWDLCNILDCGMYKIWAFIMPQLCSYLLSKKVDAYFYKHRDVLNGTFGE